MPRKIEPVRPIRQAGPEDPCSPAGLYMHRRLAAAAQAARLLRPLNPIKYGELSTEIANMARRERHTAMDRVALEDAIARAGRLYRTVCAVMTRNDG